MVEQPRPGTKCSAKHLRPGVIQPSSEPNSNIQISNGFSRVTFPKWIIDVPSNDYSDYLTTIAP